MNIFLWGFMGSGKSKLGKRLANKLNYQFVDLDKYIETEENQSITEIFAQFGEEKFRALETKYLEDIINSKKDVLLSCGGGTPCFNQNKGLMNANGLTIYLEVDHNVLVSRLWHGKAHRPLIAKMQNQEELSAYIEQALNERNAYYKTAALSFNNSYPKGDITPFADSVKELLENLEEKEQ